jgi:hypothetical protein
MLSREQDLLGCPAIPQHEHCIESLEFAEELLLPVCGFAQQGSRSSLPCSSYQLSCCQEGIQLVQPCLSGAPSRVYGLMMTIADSSLVEIWAEHGSSSQKAHDIWAFPLITCVCL